MARYNYIANPSFAEGIAGYTAIGGASIGVTSDYTYSGPQSLKVTKSGTNRNGIQTTSAIPVSGGLSYAFSTYSLVPRTIPVTEATSLTIEWTWYSDQAGTVVLTVQKSEPNTVEQGSTWDRLTDIKTAPDSAQSVSIAIFQETGGLADQNFYLDALMLEQSRYVGGFHMNLSTSEQSRVVNTALSNVPDRVLEGMELKADISLNDLVFNTVDEDKTLWVCTDVDGWWGLSSPESPDIARGVEDGSYDVSGRLAARVMTLTGVFIPASNQTLAQARDKLVNAVNLVRKGGWLKTSEDPTKAAFVRLSGRPMIQTVNSRGRTEFSIGLKASDPIKYEWNDADPEGLFTASIPAAENYVDVVNNGTADVRGVFKIYGPAGAGATIYNAGSDETLTLSEPLRGEGIIADVMETSIFQGVPTIRTAVPHGLLVGDTIEVRGVGFPYDSLPGQVYIVTSVHDDDSPYTFTYTNTDGTPIREWVDFSVDYTNLYKNPSVEGSITQETNITSNVAAFPTGEYAPTTTELGFTDLIGAGSGGAAAYQRISGAIDGPTGPGMNVSGYIRKSWSIATSTDTDTGIALSMSGASAKRFVAVSDFSDNEIRVRVRTSRKKKFRILFNYYTDAGAYTFSEYGSPSGGVDAISLPGQWVTVTGTVNNGTSPGNAQKYRYQPVLVSEAIPGSDDPLPGWKTGDYLDATALFLQGTGEGNPGTYAGRDYFDGDSTQLDENLVYVWAGLPKRSVSTLKAKSVPNSDGVTSSAWSASGSYSARLVIPDHIATQGAFPGTGLSFTAASDLVVGNTYTMMATVHVKNTVPEIPNRPGYSVDTKRRLFIWYGNNNSDFETSEPFPNQPGTYNMRWTFVFKTPSWPGVRPQIGMHGVGLDGSLWVDNLLLVAGNYTGTYFDGSTQSDNLGVQYQWSGVPLDSTSQMLTGSQELVDDLTAQSGVGQIYLTNDDILEVDTYERSVILNGETLGNRRKISTLTDWIRMVPGKNSIKFDDSAASVNVLSKAVASSVLTLGTEKAHLYNPGDQVVLSLPEQATLTSRSLTSNVATLTTSAPHGFSIGDSIDVQIQSTTVLSKKSRTSGLARFTTVVDGGFQVGDSVRIDLPLTVFLFTKAVASNVVTLSSTVPHGFSNNDSVKISLPASLLVTQKARSNNIATLSKTAWGTPGLSIGDSVAVALPTSATVVKKASLGNTVTLTTSVPHGFSIGDQITFTPAITATLTNNQSMSGTPSRMATINTTGAHGFSVGDRIQVNTGLTATTTVTNRSSTTTTCTLTVGTHSYVVGERVVVSGVGSRYDGTFVISAVAATTFSYVFNSPVESSVTSTGFVNNLTIAQGYNGSKVIEAVTSTSISYYAWDDEVASTNTKTGVGASLTNTTNDFMDGTRTLTAVSAQTMSYLGG